MTPPHNTIIDNEISVLLLHTPEWYLWLVGVAILMAGLMLAIMFIMRSRS
jgi:uncharacterized protein involved in cysteine biosynthesis